MTKQAVSAHTPAYAAADLTNCDREPIHIPGAIQPHGVLLAVDADLRDVVMASANAGAMLGVADDAVLGASLTDLLGEEAVASVRDSVEGDRAEVLHLRLEHLAARGATMPTYVDAAVHRSGGRVVVELEGADPHDEALRHYRTARGAMQRLARTASVVELAEGLVGEIADLTGFDRVMVYRFDEDWNGEVVAERRRADLNPFLGLHYPSTDIPAQARRLYTVNWIRLIADISYTPVAIQPVLDPDSGEPLDLSHSTLRSVSPIHIEYLSNMGVTASMSVSLVVDGELWGLIACHHYSGPHVLSLDVRSASEFLGQVASQLVAERERADDREAMMRSEALLAQVQQATSLAPNPLETLMRTRQLTELMGAGGVALCFDGELTTLGTVPDEAALRRIAELLRLPESQPGASRHLQALDPALARVADTAAGALAIGSAPDRWLCWVRPELTEVVDWGGDPTNKQLALAEDPQVRLSPRQSFEKWQQVVRGHSEPWQSWHLDNASHLASHVASLLYANSREQVDMAESLQRSVIPTHAPRVAGLEMAARYLPASTFQMGGDWWDAFPLPGGRVAFVVGDVAGHGVAAATTMTQLRAAVRAHLFGDESPARVLDRTDRFMDGLFEQVIATAVVGTVEPSTGRVVLAAAGHPPPLLVQGGTARELAVATRPVLGLGVTGAAETEVVLDAGSTLLLYTDGLVERRGIDLATSTALLVDLAARGPGESGMEDWVDQMLLAVPGARDDDTTVLAIKLGPR